MTEKPAVGFLIQLKEHERKRKKCEEKLSKSLRLKTLNTDTDKLQTQINYDNRLGCV